MATSNRIIIRGEPAWREGIANETITPGHLIEPLGGSAATAGYFKKHATAGGSNVLPRFMLQEDYIGATIDATAASGDQIPYGIFKAGDEVNAWLASGQNVGVNQALESNGDGTLRAVIPQSAVGSTQIKTNQVVGYAKEPINASAAAARIVVEVI